jgi:hypothetical protein
MLGSEADREVVERSGERSGYSSVHDQKKEKKKKRWASFEI